MLAFFITIFGMALLGATLAVACGAIVGGGWTLRLTAAGLALAACVLAAVPMGVHRAGSRTLIFATRRYRLPSRVAGFLFDRIVQAKGGQIGKAVESVPAHQIESNIREAMREIFGKHIAAGGLRGFVARQIHRRLVREVERATLAEFRRSTDGKFDLPAMRQHLCNETDAAVERRLTTASRRFTLLLATALSIVILAAALITRRYITPAAPIAPTPATAAAPAEPPPEPIGPIEPEVR